MAPHRRLVLPEARLHGQERRKSPAAFPGLALAWRSCCRCQGRRLQGSDSLDDRCEQLAWDRDLGHLKGDVPAVTDRLRSDLDQLFAQRRQRSLGNRLRIRQRAEEVSEVVRQRVKLEANRVRIEPFFDASLGRCALVTEGDYIRRFAAQVRDDEADAREQVPGVLLHLSDNPTRTRPTRCLVAEALTDRRNMPTRAWRPFFPVRASARRPPTDVVRPSVSSHSRYASKPASEVTTEPRNGTMMRRSKSIRRMSFFASPVGFVTSASHD